MSATWPKNAAGGVVRHRFGRTVALMIASLELAAAVAAPVVPAHEDPRERADRIAQRLVEHPESVALLVEHARQLRLARDSAGALAELERAATICACGPAVPAAREIALERALAFVELGNGNAAQSELDRVMWTGPPSARALALRARLRAGSGRLEEALVDFGASLALRDDVALYAERGQLLESLGRLDEAAAGYRDALVALPHADPLVRALVRVELARGEPDDALAVVDGELGAGRATAAWLLLRAEVLEARGDSQGARRSRMDARRAARVALAVRPTNLHRLAYAETEVALGNLAAASEAADTVLAAQPGLVAAEDLVARIQAVTAQQRRRTAAAVAAGFANPR